MKKNVSDPVHTNSFSKRSTFVSSKLRGFFWVHASRCIVFLNTYSSICECLIERNIKRYLNIKNISTCSFAIFVLYLRREALKKSALRYHVIVLKRLCFWLSFPLLMAFSNPFAFIWKRIRFQAFQCERKAKRHRNVPVFKRKRISADGFLTDTDQQTRQILQ